MMADIEDRLVDLTRELVDRPSENPPGEEGAVAAFLQDRLASSEIDFEIEMQEVRPGRPNVIARAGDSGVGTVLLMGHMDVVPANPPNWTDDPFHLERCDDQLVGRGTADMKAALAAKLLAAEKYLLETDHPGEVVLVFVVGEEKGGIGAEAVVEMGIEADGAIVGEPTMMQVSIAEKGVARYRITTNGRSAHSGSPKEGINAIDAMRTIFDALDTLEAAVQSQQHPLLSPETVTVTEINGGLAPNVVPDETTITVDWRYLPLSDIDSRMFDARLRDTLSTPYLDSQPFDVEYERLSFGRASETDKDTAIVRAVQSAAEDVTGGSRLAGFNAITDAQYLRLDADIPTVLFGPGSIEHDAHTVDESINTFDLIDTANVYYHSIEKFLSS